MKIINVQEAKGTFVQAFVDDEDFEMLNKYKWYTLKSHKKGITSAVAKPLIDGKRTTKYMHRMILGLTDKSVHVDHIDRDPLNNQKNNLRTCTIAENNFNRMRERQSHDIPYKGVYMRDTRKNMSKPYCVKIGFEGHRITLDTNFSNMEEAAKVYDMLATKIHGEFASLNFPK